MNTAINLGTDREYGLQHAILVYGDGHESIAVLHPILALPEGGAPYLGAGSLCSTAFLQSLTKAMGGRVAPEILPASVLARTPDLLVWWTPAQRRMAFYRCAKTDPAQQLNGTKATHPALVWKVVRGTRLYVRALAASERPAADTRLFHAPYYNVGRDGEVCLGSMRVPAAGGVAAIPAWEREFYDSAFTHPVPGAVAPKHPKGFVALWQEAARRPSFPVRHLAPAGSLAQFVQGEAR